MLTLFWLFSNHHFVVFDDISKAAGICYPYFLIFFSGQAGKCKLAMYNRVYFIANGEICTSRSALYYGIAA